MDRGTYLRICQKNAVNKKKIAVSVDGTPYIADRLEIWFDGNGNTQNTAIVKELRCNSYIRVLVERLEEYEK